MRQPNLVMHSSTRGSSMLEIMAMIAILGLAMSTIFATVVSGIRFAKDSENRIKAINVAREGIEGVMNLRNTNWLRFSSDRTNCWKAQDYSSSCIGNGASSQLVDGTYTLSNKNGAWYLDNPATTGSGLWIDSSGFYTGVGSPTDPICDSARTLSCRSVFTRTITLSNVSASGMTVTSTVNWVENRPQQLTLQSTLTNWKSKF